MSPEKTAAALLRALTERYTPPGDDRHVLFYDVEYDRLALRIAAHTPMDSIYLDPGDLSKPAEQLVAEVDDIVHQIAQKKLAELHKTQEE